ncbi:hypothetical protein ABW19_dt0205990 [Dactylella cylindrospora]|nr:hypothetical protein ABW19_dt0205990 [Dactylella cylindrospora]
MEDVEPPSKRRKVDTPSDTDAAETETAPTSLKSNLSFAVEITVGGGSETPPCGSSNSSSKPTSEPSSQRRKSKQSTPKERTPEFLDLRIIRYKAQEKEVATWLDILNRKKKIIVIAGAGISVGAGIPDFRSSTGLFASVKNDYKLKASGKQLFDASVYKDDKSTSSFHDMVRNLHSMSFGARPTAFHHLLASLAVSGRLLRLYTQNVDCIETSLEPLATRTPLNGKGPWPKTIQLHGGLDKMTCSKCRTLKDFNADIFIGPKPPDCADCVGDEAARDASGKRSQGIGRMRPRIVLYNEHNPDEDAIGTVSAADLKARPDCLIVVGTSLKIPGVQRLVRELCASIRDFRGGKTVWINRDNPPATGQMKGLFDLTIKGDCETLAKISNVKHYDQFTPECDMKKITGTGMELGVSTPISMDSDLDSPLSSPASYSSSEEILEDMKNGRQANIPWPPPKVVILKRPLSPSASPHPKKATPPDNDKNLEKKSDKKPAKKTKAGSATAKSRAVSAGSKKKVILAKPIAKKAKIPKTPTKKAKITTAFKTSKANVQNAKVKKAAAPSTPDAAKPSKPVQPVKRLEGGKPIRVSIETLKRQAEELAANTTPKTESPKLILHGSDSSLTDISTPMSSPSSLDPTRGMKIRDLLT